MIAKKYIEYNNDRIYAIYYNSNNTIYYNVNFRGKTQMIIVKYPISSPY